MNNGTVLIHYRLCSTYYINIYYVSIKKVIDMLIDLIQLYWPSVSITLKVVVVQLKKKNKKNFC